MTVGDDLAAEFEVQRGYLHAIAFRMLGSHADADDAVQEAWLRLARTGRDGVEDLRGWLTTVTSRICLDALRRRGVRGEQPLELDIGALPGEALGAARIDPEEEAVLADSVGLALYVVMDALTPAERVSFVLHDVFEVPFDTIATILGRSTAATKMLASRARGRLRPGVPTTDAHASARKVIDAFMTAVGRGDVTELLTLLAPDIELRAQGPDGTFVLHGAGEVASQTTTYARPDALGHPALVGGAPGVLITIGGKPVTVLVFTVTDGTITGIDVLTDPPRLAQLVPSWVA